MASNESKFVSLPITLEGIDHIVLSEFPYPIATNYRKALTAGSWESCTRKSVEVFEYVVRAITLGLVSAYLTRDLKKVSDTELNSKLYQKLPRASLGQWVEFLFLCLRAYGDKRELFFIQELYDVYWNTARTPHTRRKRVRIPYDRLVNIRNDLAHGVPPDKESAWENICWEALKNLRIVLEQFRFLGEYNLIRITDVENERYTYDCYTGEIVTHRDERVKMSEKVQPGWFYLSRADRSLLRMHPLLIFWSKEKEQEADDDERQDVAVFNRLLREGVEYMATVIRELIKEEDVDLLAQFRQLIYYNLEHVKMAKKQETLSWRSVQATANEISGQQMEAVRKKYNPDLYLQRDGVFSVFQDFVVSDKGCLILTGKSGVGKSNFILSLGDEYANAPDAAVLMYDAARLDSQEEIGLRISQDFSQHIKVNEDAEKWDIFAELADNEDMANKRLVVVFDAVNENPDSRGLLSKIDQLVDQVRHPWLKVLVTSRPEAWRTIKRGLRLAEERYFRCHGTEDMLVELEEFVVKLDPFERAELKSAYENYRRIYRLQTEYSDIRPPIRFALRDPLVLRLVSGIYEGAEIPQNLRVSDIYSNYIEHLLETGLLDPQDLRLLEHELMPMMLRDGHYDNHLSTDQVQSEKISDGRPLWELIYSGDLLSSGQRVNESFMHLVDAEILVEHGVGLETNIGFEYERFYEFFGGRRLHSAMKDTTDTMGIYLGVAGALPDKVFLWGALVQGLEFELKAGRTSVLERLSGETTGNPLLHSALVKALARFGGDSPQKAEEYVWALLGKMTLPSRFIWTDLRRILRPPKDPPLEAQAKKRVAIDAASRLRITNLLEQAAAEPTPYIRNLASQNIYYLWREDPEAGFEVLEGLSARVRRDYGLPDLAVAESMLSSLVAIMGKEHSDPPTMERMMAIGRRTVRRVLFLSDLDKTPRWTTRLRMVFIRLMYNIIISIILRFVLNVMGSWGDRIWATPEGFAHVFELSPEQKKLVTTLIPFIDPDKPGLEERVDDLITAANWGDQVSQAVGEVAIIGHGVKDFSAMLEVVEQLSNAALADSPPKSWADRPIWYMWMSSNRVEDPNPDLLELCDRVTIAIQEDSRAFVEQALKDLPVPITTIHRASMLATNIGLHYRYTNEPDVPDLVLGYLERAIEEQDDEYLRLYVSIELQNLLEVGFLHSAVNGARPIGRYQSAEVRQAIVDLLLRARTHAPDFVEDVLLRGDFPKEIADQVLAKPTSESMIDLVSYQVALVIYDLFVLGPKELNEELRWLISQALVLPSFESWFTLIIRELLNLLVGEVVLRVSEDAPSRRYFGDN